MPYAGWWRRFAAIFIDGLRLALPFVAAVVIAIVATEGADDPAADDEDGVWSVVLFAWLFWIVALVRLLRDHARAAATVDALWPLWDEKKQAIYDELAKSIVVRA